MITKIMICVAIYLIVSALIYFGTALYRGWRGYSEPIMDIAFYTFLWPVLVFMIAPAFITVMLFVLPLEQLLKYYKTGKIRERLFNEASNKIGFHKPGTFYFFLKALFSPITFFKKHIALIDFKLLNWHIDLTKYFNGKIGITVIIACACLLFLCRSFIKVFNF